MANCYAMSWCQECHRWVPEKLMNYSNERRICQWCSSGIATPSAYVYDPYHGRVKCIFCDSYTVEEKAPKWGTFQCDTCGEIFTL